MKENLSALSVESLSTLARKFDLPSSGSKSALVRRVASVRPASRILVSLSRGELQTIARGRGCSRSGSRAALIGRLVLLDSSGLRFWFGLDIHNHHLISTRWRAALFHRWLPDGRDSAVQVPLDDPDLRLSLWFERRGKVQDHFIKWDSQEREVPVRLMGQQALLEAGALFGEIEVSSLPDGEVGAVVLDQQNNATRRIGKRVAKAIESGSEQLLRILRVTYGQYWLPPALEWDSRRMSLGQYLHLCNARWSVDGQDWTDFVPTERTQSAITSDVSFAGYADYLTRESWEEVGQRVAACQEPSFAAYLLVRAFELFDSGHRRHALVDAVTALEAVLKEQLDDALPPVDTKSSVINAFRSSLSLEAQLSLLASIGSRDPSAVELQTAISAIRLRNQVVHEGRDIEVSDEATIRGLIEFAASLLPNGSVRFVSPHRANQRLPASVWKAAYKGQDVFEAIRTSDRGRRRSKKTGGR